MYKVGDYLRFQTSAKGFETHPHSVLHGFQLTNGNMGWVFTFIEHMSREGNFSVVKATTMQQWRTEFNNPEPCKCWVSRRACQCSSGGDRDPWSKLPGWRSCVSKLWAQLRAACSKTNVKIDWGRLLMSTLGFHRHVHIWVQERSQTHVPTHMHQ